MAAPGTTDVDPTVEEVRVALALNGGVSLAVWMGGCAVELDRARRTRYGGSEKAVYQALVEAFRRELVVDVMSGTSAGGINGALLAAALAKGVALEAGFLRDRWLNLGDFSKLLQPLSTRAPASLMQGKFFAKQLELTFEKLCAGKPIVEPSVPALDITTTDIDGSPLKFADTWHQELRAREYRARFKFRHAADFHPHALAHAARASASFPLAFEPYAVPPDASVLAKLAGGAYVMDGGLLDNAPIRVALGLIPSRSAHRQVRRLLCYVNGDPAVEEEKKAEEEDEEQEQDGPTVAKVIGAMVDLPRKAPFADQLADLQTVTRDSGMALGAEHGLLKTDLADLTAIAKSLLPTYRRRRRLRALKYGIDEPADIEAAYELLDDPTSVDLPWLRQELPLAPGLVEWRWGIDAARRVHHLALDVLRDALPGSDAELRRDVLEHRVGIDSRIDALDRERAANFDLTKKAFRKLRPGADAAKELKQLEQQVERAAGWIARDIEATAKSLLHVMQRATSQEPNELAQGFFGDDWDTDGLTPAKRDVFMQRCVAVEVVRRSFTDDDVAHNTQKIAFAQLTPEAPAPLFSAEPFSKPFAASVARKLCGAILGHFGAFYRRAWRANDFMWGRMDAAARITDMLVGVTRSKHLHEADQHEPWNILAAKLVAAGEQHKSLLEEALADLGRSGTPDDLEARLRDVLEHDLGRDGTGKHTRIICTRAAQFEVLCDELKHVVCEATKDVKLGCNPDTLGLGGLHLDERKDVYEALVRLRAADCVLPVALGRNRAEISTDLAVRTIAHAGLITLGVSRSAGGMALTPLGVLRSALLPVSGATALHWPSRLGVVAAFAGASLYLAARIADTNTDRKVDATQMSFFGFLLAVVCLSVVLGTAAVPTVRAVLAPRVKGWPWLRARAWLWLVLAVLLLACGGFGAAVIAVWPGPLNWAHLVVAPGVAPPWYVTLPALALGAGAAVTGPRPLRKRIQQLTAAPWKGNWSMLLVVASFVLVSAWAAKPLWHAVTSDDSWRIATAVLAVAGIVVALLAVVVLPPRLAARAVPPPISGSGTKTPGTDSASAGAAAPAGTK